MTTHVTIAGAGLAGLASAYELLKRGVQVTLFERSPCPAQGSVARYAGGMLAPWVERESAEDDVVTLGAQAADWWADLTAVKRAGTLVVAPSRDLPELTRFARRTTNYQTVDAAEVARLEPALGNRFSKGLFFEQEAHLDPRQALKDLASKVEELGGEIRLNTPAPDQVDLDCRGYASALPQLRPVRGEMAILDCPEVDLTRTVRLLHPRMPLYIVPRGNGIYMIGGTMIESSSDRAISLRSLSELLSAAFTLHPAFAEAAVLETGAGLRPAFPDNLPRVWQENGTWYLNGLYRHGFLLAPAMAQKLAEQLTSKGSS